MQRTEQREAPTAKRIDCGNAIVALNYFLEEPDRQATLKLLFRKFRVTRNMGVIELRSRRTILAARDSVIAGDYSTDSAITLRLHTPFFTNWQYDPQHDLIPLLTELMAALEVLPLLTALGIEPIVKPKGAWVCCFPVAALTGLMQQKGCKMTALSISDLKLTGKNKDFDRLAELVGKNLTALKSILLKCETSLHGDNGAILLTASVSHLDNALRALTNCPSLEDISLMDGRLTADGRLSTKTVSDFVLAKKLRCLKIFGFRLTTENLEGMANAYISSTGNGSAALTNILLNCTKFSSRGGSAIQSILKANPNLKHFRLFLKDFESTEVDYICSLGQVIREVGKTSCDYFAINAPSECIPKVLVHTRKMLRRNYTITYTRITSYIHAEATNKITDREIDFLVKANQLGRGELFQKNAGDDTEGNERKVSWLTMFEATNNELTNIFYLVYSHPLEFVEMGLKDCYLSGTPNTRSMQSMFRGNRRSVLKAIEDGVSENLEAIQDGVSNSADVILEAQSEIEDAISNETFRIRETVKDTAKDTTEAIIEVLQEEIAKKVKAEIQTVQTGLDRLESVMVSSEDTKKAILEGTRTMVEIQTRLDRLESLVVGNYFLCLVLVCFAVSCASKLYA